MESMDVVQEKSVVAVSDLPWVEKYRPSTLDDLIAHEDIISICMWTMSAVYCN